MIPSENRVKRMGSNNKYQIIPSQRELPKSIRILFKYSRCVT